MKRSILSALVLSGLIANAQDYKGRVGINTDSPRASLEVKAIDVDGRAQGILFPHISDAEKKKWQPNDATGLVAGTMIWNTDLNCLDHFDGEKWQCTDGSNPYYPPINTTPDKTIKADVWNRTHYIGSFNHNGANIDGEIANTGTNALTIQIPYNQATAGKSYNEINVTRTVQDRSGANKTLTLHIPAGTFTAAKGLLNATIKVGNGTTDVYKVKQLPANTEETIAEYSFTINGGISNVRLIASGGVLDKMFNKETNNKLEHQFIYVPVSVYPVIETALPDSGEHYEKKWLNNNLGVNYAKVGNNQHTQQAISFEDKDAYGSLFQWQRPADGHEIVIWTANATTPTLTPAVYYPKGSSNWTATHSNFITLQLNSGASWVYNYTSNRRLWEAGGTNNPCPNGYHVPKFEDYETVRKQVYGNKSVSEWYRYPGLVPTKGGGRFAEGGHYYDPTVWTTTTENNAKHNVIFQEGRWGIGYHASAYSIRCISD